MNWLMGRFIVEDIKTSLGYLKEQKRFAVTVKFFMLVIVHSHRGTTDYIGDCPQSPM